jgi:cysteine desulfurase / selenocysteine lyase
MTKPLSAAEVNAIRADFPVLQQTVNGHDLVYLDNAATTQKPQVVIDALTEFYQTYNANVHRGIHHLSEKATQAYEDARLTVQQFINAQASQEIIFCRGTTEAINLVAHSFVKPILQPGDEILVTYMEHHSNIVPWQILCEQTGASLKAIPLTPSGELDLESCTQLLTSNTKLLALAHISNSLGTVNPVKALTQAAHEKGCYVLVDGAQGVPHECVDVSDLDCDFYAFSAHKLYGPTGVGVLYAKQAHLEQMTPYQGGGEMIAHVSFERTEYAPLPHKFEAGTPNIAGVIGMARAMDYLTTIGLDRIKATELALYQQLEDRVKATPGLTMLGNAANKAPIFTFVMKGIHAHDVGTVLNTFGIAVRSGHLCTIPAIEYYQQTAVSRASISFYNTFAEVEKLVVGLQEVNALLG